jgi:L-lactate dehydrogenase complex protein LldG
MSGPRARILERVRAGLLRAHLPEAAADPRRLAATPSAADGAQLAAAFSARIEALNGRVHRAASAAEVPDIVAGLAAEAGAARFISWDEDQLGCPGLLAALAARGVVRVVYEVPSDEPARTRLLADLGAVPLGLTGADGALADSGGIVLVNGPGRGRLPSLLPPIHIAIVQAADLVPGLGPFLAARPGLFDEASNVVVVAGPSRTADIEMTLTHGVHGPKHLHVVLVG